MQSGRRDLNPRPPEPHLWRRVLRSGHCVLFHCRNVLLRPSHLLPMSGFVRLNWSKIVVPCGRSPSQSQTPAFDAVGHTATLRTRIPPSSTTVRPRRGAGRDRRERSRSRTCGRPTPIAARYSETPPLRWPKGSYRLLPQQWATSEDVIPHVMSVALKNTPGQAPSDQRRHGMRKHVTDARAEIPQGIPAPALRVASSGQAARAPRAGHHRTKRQPASDSRGGQARRSRSAS